VQLAAAHWDRLVAEEVQWEVDWEVEPVEEGLQPFCKTSDTPNTRHKNPMNNEYN
jgi:hypothetical protein